MNIVTIENGQGVGRVEGFTGGQAQLDDIKAKIEELNYFISHASNVNKGAYQQALENLNSFYFQQTGQSLIHKYEYHGKDPYHIVYNELTGYRVDEFGGDYAMPMLLKERSQLEGLLNDESATEADKVLYLNVIAAIDKFIEEYKFQNEQTKSKRGLHGMSMNLEQLSQRF